MYWNSLGLSNTLNFDEQIKVISSKYQSLKG